jgi:hypothetical protein
MRIHFTTAIDAKTGKILWRHRSFPRASFLFADGRFIILDEDGDLLLATATRESLTVTRNWNCLRSSRGPYPHCKRTINQKSQDLVGILALSFSESPPERATEILRC